MEEIIMTNTTKLTAAALFSALVLGASFAGNTVSAAPGPNPDNNGKVSETGHAYVTFTKDGGSQVKHPSDPGVSYTPSNTTDVTNETGSITLDAIPSSLNFGTQETTGASQTVQLLQSEGKDFSNGKDGSTTDQTTLADGTKADRKISSNGPATSDSGASSDTTGKNDTIFTQVTNVSSNQDITWTLSATLSNFYAAGKAADPKTNAIPGAFITMKDGKHVKDTIDGEKESWMPTTDKIDAGLTLNANTSTKIVGATKDKGIFQQQWNVGGVTLTAPQGAPVGQYTADIAWTLEAGPAADLDAAAPVTRTGSETPDATKTPDDGTN
ncbi:hypothetical protein FD01_GL000446 [Lacticaseibacillus manihotivorans DSM 13343 = JCM 12514]|jgi:hypothetical protein|uniref:WxL domain-containing protein n=2 Tax=Lacticaseibacillus manihotivorans TaxID=88233 RepID=A0A0R1RJ57_9LACO|nr:hypothetical protein FD01_GL000446 [Lacticaseibacillus manihotivorans DSM 13343 = JCM 12514]